MKRCPECGSWEAECGSEFPVPGCGCARCLSAELDRMRAWARKAAWHLREHNSEYQHRTPDDFIKEVE